MWQLGVANGYVIANKMLYKMAKFQDCRDVLSGMPQGSVLGPIDLLIFVNDIDTVISSHIQKLAGDCKVFRLAPTAEDIDILQQDIYINNLCQWSKDWQMVFNVKKCKVLIVWDIKVHIVIIV